MPQTNVNVVEGGSEIPTGMFAQLANRGRTRVDDLPMAPPPPNIPYNIEASIRDVTDEHQQDQMIPPIDDQFVYEGEDMLDLPMPPQSPPQMPDAGISQDIMESAHMIRREKQKLLEELNQLSAVTGVTVADMGMHTHVDVLRMERDILQRKVDVKASIVQMRRMLIAMVGAIEYGSQKHPKYCPLNLGGWSGACPPSTMEPRITGVEV